MNNNYNSNTVVNQDFAVVEQIDGRVKSLESNCNVLVRFFPKKLSTGGGVIALRINFRGKNRCPLKNLPRQPLGGPGAGRALPLPDHAGSIPEGLYGKIT